MLSFIVKFNIENTIYGNIYNNYRSKYDQFKSFQNLFHMVLFLEIR